MSAIRNSSSRSESRKSRSSPYARIVKNTVRAVYQTFGWYYPEDDAQHSSTPLSTQSNATSQTITSSEKRHDPNGRDASGQQHTNINRLPLTPREPVNNNLRSRDPIPSDVPNTRPPSPVEPMDTDSPERSTWGGFRSTTPGHGSPSFTSTTPNVQTATPTPRKKLARNPNGSYRWEGAGSAKQARPRNRYASPVFGVSPSKPERLVMKESTSSGEMSLSDNKRRKVEDEGSTSSDSSKNLPPVPFPRSSSPTTPRTNGTNGTTAKPNAISSSSRLRTPAKPTAPVVPSPLRQAWSGASSTSSRDETRKSPSQPAKQTKTANFMAELIKETSPPKKPDLSNPYQSASPVGKVGPPRRGTKRTRATGKPSTPGQDQVADEKKAKDEEKEKEKVKEYSPQAIIEATVPKGSKRSRPPAHFEKRASSEETSGSPPAQREPPVVVETRKVTYIVEEPEQDEDESRRSTKKAKPTINGYGPPPPARQKTSVLPPEADITVEEVDIVMQVTETEKEKAREVPKLTTQVNGNGSVAPVSATSPTSRSSFNGFKANSIPKEPSKLRFSFQAEASSATPSSPATAPAPSLQPTPPPLPKTDFKFSPPSSGFNFTFKVDDNVTSPKSQPKSLTPETKDAELSSVGDIKARVRAMDAASLPVFTFTATGTSVLPSTVDHVKAQSDAKALSRSSLPTFDFESSKPTASFSFNYDPSKGKEPGSYSGSYKPSPPKPARPFTIGPSFPNPSGPSSFSATPAPVKAFDFAAAGMKAPTTSKDTKACSLCGLSNAASASKCSTCDEPFPGSIPTAPAPAPALTPPAPPVKGFDWAAAGMKVPTASKGAWTCSSCGLSSPDTTQECTVCGDAKP